MPQLRHLFTVVSQLIYTKLIPGNGEINSSLHVGLWEEDGLPLLLSSVYRHTSHLRNQLQVVDELMSLDGLLLTIVQRDHPSPPFWNQWASSSRHRWFGLRLHLLHQLVHNVYLVLLQLLAARIVFVVSLHLY